jgi:peptide/nickel transport system ATP-binding protein
MSSVLQVTNLSKTFGHGDIFRDVSFTLNAGETIGLFGPSGCGKSTLGRCILGLEKLTKGSVLFEGKDIFRLDRKERSCLQAKMQMVFQHPEVSFDPRRRLIYSVTEPLVYHEKGESEDVLHSLLPLIHAVGLHPGILDKYPGQLSGGELQRAMMVRIYSLSPHLLIADEPTSMLDMSVQAQILNLMKEMQKKNSTACIFISHDPEVMQVMCDRIGVMSEGKCEIMNKNNFSEWIQPLLVMDTMEKDHYECLLTS